MARQPQPGEARDHQDGDQPLGAFGDAHIRLEPQGFGLRPDVGNHHAKDKADDGGNGYRCIRAAGEKPDGQAGEQGAVGHPVQAWSPGSCPSAPPRSCIRAMMPSMTSEKMKAVMKMRSPPELAQRVEHQGADHHAGGSRRW